MPKRSFAQFDAFSETPFGGSQAAVISDAAGLDADTRFRIARELGLPATVFVGRVTQDAIQAQFFSMVAELPMCGHGTLCLVTHVVESGALRLDTGQAEIALHLPDTTARVGVTRRPDGRIEVMLEIAPPSFRATEIDAATIAGQLGLDADALDSALPIEIADGDFTHLVVPVRDLAAMQAIAPDLHALRTFCLARQIETVAAFSTETTQPWADLHVRDFCPAVGVPESASAGTTNAALVCYLVRHGLIDRSDGARTIRAEQGLELGRPSAVRSDIHLTGREIRSLRTGGVATKLIDGWIGLA